MLLLFVTDSPSSSLLLERQLLAASPHDLTAVMLLTAWSRHTMLLFAWVKSQLHPQHMPFEGWTEVGLAGYSFQNRDPVSVPLAWFQDQQQVLGPAIGGWWWWLLEQHTGGGQLHSMVK